MKCEPRTKLPEMMYKTVKHPDLKKIFSIIKTTYEGNMEFGPWYVDISHRKRHDCARVYLINDLLDSKPASACLISAESDCAGLISGVSTLPQYRGRGYATTGVIQACTDLRHDRKLPLLECYDEKRPYYEKLGFEFLLKTAELTLT
jgi:predicted GNAT family acetyltransferase